jgi:phosphoglucosamine mutase
MTKRYFGTDGVRGTINQFPMTAETALRLGLASARYFRRADPHRHSVVIGKDTRLSGYALEAALVAGFTSAGMDVVQFGPLPTPGVAMLTRSLRADMGVMITASHNPYHDNGIKLFGPDGHKLADSAEIEIEALIDSDLTEGLAAPREMGRARRIEESEARYVEIVKATVPRQLRLTGLKVVVDCANGAAYKAAPKVFWELGADVIPINNAPDGFNINDRCGAVHPQTMAEAVRRHGADIGVALDGDADRVILADETGRVVDGDQILGLIALGWKRSGRLANGHVVATQMSNLGLERKLETAGLMLERAKVGDRYVVEAMRAGGANLGGEASGHIVLSDFATTGDGLIAALQVMALLVEQGGRASALLNVFDPVPQLLRNVRFETGADPMNAGSVKDAIARAEALLDGRGRLLVRKSGTEPLIRVMAEGEAGVIEQAVETVCSAVRGAAA